MSQVQKKMKVKLVRGLMRARRQHRATVRGLGLKYINQTVILDDTQAIRGMVRQVSYLVDCEAVHAS